MNKSFRGYAFSVNEEVIEAVEASFAKQEKSPILKVLEALKVRGNKCTRLRSEYAE